MNEKMILGTVQFGLNYGINNNSGKPSENKVFNVLDIAYENGIQYLDTADAYGDAIQIIGKYHQQSKNKFKLLSKFKGVKTGELKGKVIESLEILEIKSYEVYSFHSFNELIENSVFIKELSQLKVSDLINKIGISVYTNQEFEKVIEYDFFDVIQIPFNILDNSNLRGKLIEKAKLKGKEIHTRSVFLQGLFFMNELPIKLKPLDRYISIINAYCRKEKISMQELALSYAIFNKNINHVIIGVDNKEQLLLNLNTTTPHDKASNFINDNILVQEIELLNPVNWK